MWVAREDPHPFKKGAHSVGVQRQYTGTAGKVTNCQIGVSLTLATPQDHRPVDCELYLPESWAHDDARRAEARIPDQVTFKTKPQLALDMLRRAVNAGLPRGAVVADDAGSPSLPATSRNNSSPTPASVATRGVREPASR
jgi:SRSO17 transposase